MNTRQDREPPYLAAIVASRNSDDPAVIAEVIANERAAHARAVEAGWFEPDDPAGLAAMIDYAIESVMVRRELARWRDEGGAS